MKWLNCKCVCVCVFVVYFNVHCMYIGMLKYFCLHVHEFVFVGMIMYCTLYLCVCMNTCIMHTYMNILRCVHA